MPSGMAEVNEEDEEVGEEEGEEGVILGLPHVWKLNKVLSAVKNFTKYRVSIFHYNRFSDFTLHLALTNKYRNIKNWLY